MYEGDNCRVEVNEVNFPLERKMWLLAIMSCLRSSSHVEEFRIETIQPWGLYTVNGKASLVNFLHGWNRARKRYLHRRWHMGGRQGRRDYSVLPGLWRWKWSISDSALRYLVRSYRSSSYFNMLIRFLQLYYLAIVWRFESPCCIHWMRALWCQNVFYLEGYGMVIVE